jgi:type I restriction-modification system DNA methylase subunit
MTTQITEEELLNFMHQMHCKLRSAKNIKLTGMPALNELENILLFRFIEEMKEIKNIPNNIKFSYVCEQYATDEKMNEDKRIPELQNRNYFKLWDYFYNSSNENCALLQYLNNETISKYITSKITRISAFVEKKMSGPIIQELFNAIYNKFKNIKFDSKFYDMFGAMHERFKTEAHGNGGKHTGQHFTPSEIKNLIIQELNVKSTEIFYEPCAGTGGFIHTVDKYVRNSEGEKASIKFKKNIIANECNPEITKGLMINMLLHHIIVDNIHEEDSLCYQNIIKIKNKIDVIATNYPFGMSNTIDLNDYYEENKYWDILVKNKKVIKNSSAQFIIHIYNSLKQDGRAMFVSDCGIIFNGDSNSWEASLRKFLILNSNIQKIILLPEGIFPYTNFATCIVLLKKGEATTNLNIYESNFIDKKNKTGLIVNTTSSKIFTIQELINNGYSFKLNDKKEELKTGWVKLGDVMNHIKTPYKDSSVINDNGIYIYYSSSIINYNKTNEYTNEEECLIINKTNGSGRCKIFYNNKTKFCASSATIIFNFKENIKFKFGYYFMMLNISNIEKLYSGGDKKSLNLSDFKNFQIPLLSLEHQDEIILFLDEQFLIHDINEYNNINENIDIFDFLMKKKYEYVMDVLHVCYRKIENIKIIEKIEGDKKACFNIFYSNIDGELKTLDELVKINMGGTPLTSNETYWNGTHCWCSISDLSKNTYTNIIETTKNKITDVGIKNSSVKLVIKDSIMVSFKLSIGKVGIAKNDMFCNEAIMFFKHDDETTNLFLMYYFKYVNFSKGLIGGNMGGGSLNKSSLKKVIIKIPSIEQQQTIINQIKTITIMQEHHIKYNEILQNQIEIFKQKPIETNTNLNNFITLKINEEETKNNEPELKMTITDEIESLKYLLTIDIPENLVKNTIDLMKSYKPDKGYIVKMISVKKINKLWKLTDNFIPENFDEKLDDLKLKYLLSRKNLLDGHVKIPPKLIFDNDKFTFNNGRNRFSNLRDIGCDKMPFLMTKDILNYLQGLP